MLAGGNLGIYTVVWKTLSYIALLFLCSAIFYVVILDILQGFVHGIMNTEH